MDALLERQPEDRWNSSRDPGELGCPDPRTREEVMNSRRGYGHLVLVEQGKGLAVVGGADPVEGSGPQSCHPSPSFVDLVGGRQQVRVELVRELGHVPLDRLTRPTRLLGCHRGGGGIRMFACSDEVEERGEHMPSSQAGDIPLGEVVYCRELADGDAFERGVLLGLDVLV
ncbi:hypothetical protein JOD54_006560 [Actinokineospora baliensis]|nr:hypothetical protein [Actinokineospora baliensis]